MPAGKGQNRTTYPRAFDGRELPSYLSDDMVGELEVSRMSASEYGHIAVADLLMEGVYQAGTKVIVKKDIRLSVIEIVKTLGCPGSAAVELASHSYIEKVVKYLRARKQIQPTKSPDTYTVLPKAPVSIDRDAAIQQLLETCEKQKDELKERQAVVDDLNDQVEKLTLELQNLKDLPPAGVDPKIVEQLISKCEELEEQNRSTLLRFEETIRPKQAEIDRLQGLLTRSEEARERADASNINLAEQLEELGRQLMEITEERDGLAAKVETLEKVTRHHDELDAGTLARLKRLGLG